MATIKDVAALADVSCGTVSNVINNRGNVSVRKMKLVEEAISQLGYSVNQSAKTLRQKNRRAIGMVVPDMHSQHYINFYESLASYMRNFDYVVEIFSSSNLVQHETNTIRNMVSSNVNCIVSFPTYINSNIIYNAIPESIYLVVIGPKPANITRQYLSASFDYECIGNDIADYVIQKNYKYVALLVDSVRFSEAFTLTITNRLEKVGVFVKTYGSTTRNAMIRAFDFLGQPVEYDAIITSNLLRARFVKQTHVNFHQKKTPEVITLSSSNNVFGDDLTCVYLDYARMGDLLAQNLIRHLVDKKIIEQSLTLATNGISQHNISLPVFLGKESIKIIAPDGHFSRGLNKLLPQFTSKSKVEVSLTLLPRSAYMQRANQTMLNDGCDILVSDINHFHSSKREHYMKKSDNPLLWRELNDSIDSQNTYFPLVSRDNLCFSFNSACQMLFYRNDLFLDHSIKRSFYERFFRELQVPSSLQEFDRITDFFTKTLNPSSPLLYGNSMSSIDSNAAVEELFFRMQASGFSSAKIGERCNFANPLFIETLLNYFRRISTSNAANPNNKSNSIDDFVCGKSMLSLLSTADTPVFYDNKYHEISDCIKCSDVPGSVPMNSCDIIGILSNSKKKEEAAAFLQWAFHDTVSSILTLMSGQPILKSVTTNTEVLTLFPWLRHFDRNIKKGKFPSEVIPPLFQRDTDLGEFMRLISGCYNDPNTLHDSTQEFSVQSSQFWKSLERPD